MQINQPLIFLIYLAVMLWGRGDLSLLKVKLVITRENGQINETVTTKTKKIVKCMQPICQGKCKIHEFRLRKAEFCGGGPISLKDIDLSASFCPVEFIGSIDGGHPEFNTDRRSDTPSFMMKYQKLKERDHRRYEEMLLKGQTSQESQQQKQNFRRNSPNISKTCQILDSNFMAKEDEIFVSEILEILKTRHSSTNLSA